MFLLKKLDEFLIRKATSLVAWLQDALQLKHDYVHYVIFFVNFWMMIMILYMVIQLAWKGSQDFILLFVLLMFQWSVFNALRDSYQKEGFQPVEIISRRKQRIISLILTPIVLFISANFFFLRWQQPKAQLFFCTLLASLTAIVVAEYFMCTSEPPSRRKFRKTNPLIASGA
jgi:hypothetical protein